MSGGSYNYIYNRLLMECADCMYDAEMNDMIVDLCDVLHDLEWWQSGDSSEEQYRETLKKFKAKWFRTDRVDRLKEYIDKQISVVRSQLYSVIGINTEEDECLMCGGDCAIDPKDRRCNKEGY